MLRDREPRSVRAELRGEAELHFSRLMACIMTLPAGTLLGEARVRQVFSEGMDAIIRNYLAGARRLYS
jgi:hypothetical protein